MGASDFSKATLQITIPTPDGAVVGAVNLSRDDTELYVTEGSNSGFKPYGFAIFNRATGKKRCATLLQGIQMWSSPTGGNSDDVFIAGGSGNIWRFSTKIGNNKDCALEPGWPVQTKNNLTITGPVLVLGDDRVIAAAQDGHVAMFKYDNPVSPAPGFDVKSKSLVGPMNGSDLEGWEIVGSPALAAVQDQNGTRKTLLLLSISTSKAGALVGVDVDAQTLAGMFQTGPLEAGPSVGFIDPFTHIAVVPELKLIVHGIRIDNIKWTSWDANLAGQMQQGDQFKTEASVTNGNVFLTSPSSLIGLDLVTGHQANWSPALLDSSPVSAPAVADNGNIYLAVGSSVEAFNSSTGAMIKAIPVNAQGVLVRPSIAQDGSVLVGDTQNIFEFR
jgi:outer membrane protein assembly factor BamB